MTNNITNNPRKDIPYPTLREARAAFPYAASITAAGRAQLEQHHADYSVWYAYARQLDSGELELLLDGTGSIYRCPGSWFELHAPPEEQEKQHQNPESISAWDQALGE